MWWMAVLLSGCNHEWVALEGPNDRVAMEKAYYDCLKENTSYQESSSVDRNGARSDKGMKVNRSLADACMRAKGYTLERPQKATRAAEEPVSRFDVGLGVVGGLGIGHRADHSIYLNPGLTALDGVGTDSGTRSGAMGGVDLGASFRVLPVLEVALGTGGRMVRRDVRFRGFRVRSAIEDDPGFSNEYVDGDGRDGLSPAAHVALDVRLRFPPWKRLYLAMGVGLQTLPSTPGGDAVGSIDVYDREANSYRTLSGQVSAPGVPGGLLPLARAGIGLDLVNAAPHGVRAQCFGTLVLSDGITEGDPRSVDRLGMECGLAWVFGIGKRTP